MNFYDRLCDVATSESQAALELAGTACTKAIEAIALQQELHDNTRNNAKNVAKAILHQLCDSEDVPMAERAAWSAAFHGPIKNRGFTPVTFAAAAESYSMRLAEIDALLKEPDAPIIGFITGAGGPYDNPRTAMQYAYRVSDGSGLTYAQHYNTGQKWYYHYVQAGERPLLGRLNSLDKERKYPIISYMGPDALADAVTTPLEAAKVLQHEYAKPAKVFVIGNHAVNAMFQAAGSTLRSDLLLGHAVHLGFRPAF